MTRLREVLNEAPKEDPHDYTVLSAVVVDAIAEFFGSPKGKTLLKGWEFDKTVKFQDMNVQGSKAKVHFKTPSGIKTVEIIAKSKA